MHRLTSALLFSGVVLLASFINAPAAPTPAPASVAPEDLAAIDALAPLAGDVAQETDRLRARLSTVPDKPVARRDPFSFGPAPRPSRRVPPEPALEPASAAVEKDSGVAWPTLVALLTDQGATAPVTAVLAISDSIEMLKAGDTAGGFRVREITATSVELVHVATAAVTRLPIR